MPIITKLLLFQKFPYLDTRCSMGYPLAQIKGRFHSSIVKPSITNVAKIRLDETITSDRRTYSRCNIGSIRFNTILGPSIVRTTIHPWGTKL